LQLPEIQLAECRQIKRSRQIEKIGGVAQGVDPAVERKFRLTRQHRDFPGAQLRHRVG
jgi:hypothetical protein